MKSGAKAPQNTQNGKEIKENEQRINDESI